MLDDFYSGIIEEAINHAVDEWTNSGLDADEIQRRLDTIDYSDMFLSMVKNASDDTVSYFKRTMYEKICQEQLKDEEFLIHQRQIWCEGFIASRALHILCVEAAEELGIRLSKIKPDPLHDKKYLFYSLRELHGRSCQMFLEILSLMQCGFADGAFARWRSLYELSIISLFISKNVEHVAKAYYEAQVGKEAWYNWAKAATCFKDSNRNITLQMICDQCKNTCVGWQMEYWLANKIVHATPQGTFSRMANIGNYNHIPVGQSDYGIHVPAMHSAQALSFITTVYIGIYPTPDGCVSCTSINKWVKNIGDIYSRIENECFKKPKESDIRNKVIKGATIDD